MRLSVILCGLLAAAMLVVSGCGGGTAESTTGTDSGGTTAGEPSTEGAASQGAGEEEAGGNQSQPGGEAVGGGEGSGSEAGGGEGGGNEASGGEGSSGGKAEAGGGEESSGGGGGTAQAGGGGESPAAAPLTKAQFIKRGDRICRRTSTRALKALQRSSKGNGSSAPNPKQLVDLVAPVLSQEARELSELAPPAGDEAKAAAIVSALEKGIGEVEEDPSLILKGSDPLVASKELASRYGFKVCGQ